MTERITVRMMQRFRIRNGTRHLITVLPCRVSNLFRRGLNLIKIHGVYSEIYNYIWLQCVIFSASGQVHWGFFKLKKP